ncbi:MAG: hypothetical protein U9P72_05135 [Campylobacterota bacterium]|nr:hypothetical protein [Campylobacterota bacterium]
MKKFNLFKEIIIVDKPSMLNAINSTKIFGININGQIVYEPFYEKEILIYKGQPTIVDDFTKVLGKNYQLVEDANRVLVKAFSNWQELINLNTPRASYDDTTADGVAEFSCKELEDIGWQVTEFNLRYRELVEHLEENCEGTMLCIEQEEPYQFSGLGFLSDDKHAEQVMFEYCQNHVKNKLENDDDFLRDELDDDQLEALEFFKLS